MSSRLDAPMTMTFSRRSTPSISDSSCGTIVVSTSEETPEPRVRKSASISSKKTTTGVPSEAFSRARWKIRRMWRSVSPTYLLSSSGPLMFRKKDLPTGLPSWQRSSWQATAATALAINVFPQPGGP
jgi:hypothetical protein